MKRRVLCLLVDGVEEIELVSPVDLLRRAGAEVILAALGNSLDVTGRNGIQLRADVMLDSVSDGEFDLLLIPGGPGVAALRADGRPARLAEAFNQTGKWVSAICAAPLVLKDAGILQGRKYTAHSSVVDELPEALLEELVVTDGNVITSRGAGTALEFGLSLVGLLFDEDKRREVAVAIMH